LSRTMAAAVTVSKRRLQEFLEAEMAFLAKTQSNAITIEQILEDRRPIKIAKLIHKELPARLARRIIEIEKVSPIWAQISALKEVHRHLHLSFTNLRLVEFSDANLEQFTDIIMDMRERHKDVIQLLAEVARDLKEHNIMDDASIDAWLGKFMNSRIGTEMLTEHYMMLTKQMKAHESEAHVGLVDTRCNPAKVVSDAIEFVKRNYTGASDLTFQLNVEHPDIEFSFISTYLFFIVEELLKNSIYASLMRSKREGGKPNPIRITVCADFNRVGIQITDRGGGVPFELYERLWGYQFSTTPTDFQSTFKVSRGPIAGRGFGLPLCRLYTQYFGGSLHLMSMPDVGTDAYLFLNRIEAGSDIRSSLCSVSSVSTDRSSDGW